MPLYKKVERGDFILLNDDEIVTEERLLIEGLEGITSFFASDHILNLLEEVEGKFPEDKRKMLGVIDRYLALPPNEKAIFRLGRRGGVYRSMDDLSNSELKFQLEETLKRIEKERPSGIDQVLSDLMGSFI